MTKQTPDSDDTDLFRQAIGKVAKVKQDTVWLQKSAKPVPRPQARQIERENPLQNSLAADVERLSHEDRQSFLAPGMQKNVLKKLRKGVYGLDATIDLHGLTSQRAKMQMLRFLHHCSENGLRCVHIIHGKGYRSQDNQPVLKNDVNVWLRQHQEVLAFCSAPPREGGTGAVFVLLRLSEKYREEEDAKY